MMAMALKRLGLDWILQLDAPSLRADALAGLTGAAIVLPQAVAFAAIAGLPPEYGLYTAMIPPIIAAFFGSSLFMVSGPTTAISAVVFSALSGQFVPGSPEFISAAITLALLVGLIQLAFALARVGRLAGFVSHSVMIGFTAAAAMLIFVSQLSPALGIASRHAHGAADRLLALAEGLPDWNPVAAIVAATTFAAAVLFRVFLPRWPGFLIAVMIGTLLAFALGDHASDLRYVGALPAAFAGFQLPSLPADGFGEILESAFAISLIGLLEAIAIGRSLSLRTRTDFSANREVVGQGLSNAVGSFFQCYPSSGSFTRSGINLEAGASSPFSAIFAALFLIGLVAVFRPIIGQVPVAAIAGLILYVAYRLIDFREIANLLQTSRTETVIAALTFATGLAANLELAIYVGTFASLAVFLGRSANPVLAVGAPDASNEHRKIRNAEIFRLPQCPATVILRLDGPLFFGSVDSINAELRKLSRTHPEQVNMILILQGVGEVDLAGFEMLEQEVERRRSAGGDMFIVAHYPPLVKRLRKLGLGRIVGEDRVFDNKGASIRAAVANVRPETCAACTARVFSECRGQPGADTILSKT